MARVFSSRKSWPTVVCLMAVALISIVDLVTSDGNNYDQSFQSQEESPVTFQGTPTNGHHGATPSKAEIKREMMRQLMVLQEAEESIRNKIRELQAERRVMSKSAPSHYNGICMFNVVACYRK